MNREELQVRDQLTADYLLNLQALAFEISAAIDAIAANGLTRFQASVAKQEILCAQLVSMANQCSGDLRSSDAAMEKKILETSGAIRELNLQYAALLKHSGKSISLLASLCRSHTGQIEEARGPRMKHQTWSCEM